MAARWFPMRTRGLSCLAAVAILLGSAVVVAGPAEAARKPKKPKAVVTMSAGELAVYRVGDRPASLPDDVRDGVMSTLGAYVKAATVKPLRRGTANTDVLTRTMTPGVAARLTGPDRGVLIDEGLPKSTKKITVDAVPIAIAGLADGDGRVIVVAAQFDATAVTKTAKGKVTITRKGEFELAPVDGAWKISGYTLAVDRVGKALGPTTAPTATSGPGAATGTTR
jgi:hypothetical protein